MERIREELAIFVGGSAPCADATPLWAVKEVGPALGQRPRVSWLKITKAVNQTLKSRFVHQPRHD